MNGFKKMIGTTLAAAMVAGCGTVTFAKHYDDVKDDHAAQTEISILTDIGVIKGTHEGKFSPDENVSREQMATLLFRLMLGRDDAGRVNTTDFTDLYEPYYNGAISWANAAGYILGTSATTFNPTGGITKQDAMAMLVRALGQDSEKMNEGYPWSYINAGIKLGLDRGLDGVAYDETLTRAETAVILYNALTSEYLIAKNTQSGNIYYESTSIIEEVFGYSMAQAQLVATNDYAIENSTVVKNGYVTLLCEKDGKSFYMTVKADDLDLEGDVNDYLGQSFRVIYAEENSRFTVLSAVPFSKTESFDTVKLDNDKGTVEIGGNKYTLVDEFSDELSTNNNELMLYAYDADGELELIEDNAELSELLGFYRVTLMFDGGSETAKRALIRVFEMDVLSIDDGKVNIADNKKEDDLTIHNEADAEDGDYVLYYYNPKTLELEISGILEIEAGTVKRITNSSAKIGENTYDLGNAAAGITAESIRNKLSLGHTASVVLYKDAIMAVIEGVTISDSSRYLTALSDAHRVYEDGSFRYVLTAFIDGEERNIYVKDSSAEEGKVYRYTERADVYTLIEPTVEDGIIISGRHEFIQSADGLDEIAYLIDSANGTTIELGGRNYYSMNKGDAEVLTSVAGLDNVRFVCGKNTVIVVNEDGRIMQRSGAYNSTITVNDGASVVAVFDNEVGSVETLKYLYISDGALGNYDLDAEFVRILAENGYVYEDGSAYVEYLVYNFATGEIETKLSRYGELTIGGDYRCGSDDTITDDTADVMVGGFVTGYTAGTVSVDGATFTLDENVKIIRITKDNKIENVKLSDLYMRNIEFIADHGNVTLIIEADEAEFSVDSDQNRIALTPDFDLSNFTDSKLSVKELTLGEEKLDTTGMTIAFGEGNTIVITPAEGKSFASGEYKLTFAIGVEEFSTAFSLVIIEVEIPETPEQPEQPETPDNGETETPETPDNGETETPENPDNGGTETPENPDNGETETPENPDNGETETPENPDNGETETPENPDRPEHPDRPDHPGRP